MSCFCGDGHANCVRVHGRDHAHWKQTMLLLPKQRDSVAGNLTGDATQVWLIIDAGLEQTGSRDKL